MTANPILFNTAIYYLVIVEEQGLQMPQHEPFQIDIAFAADLSGAQYKHRRGMKKTAILQKNLHKKLALTY